MHHLILFDTTCLLCHRSVHFIARRDKKKLFKFAPLGGVTAAQFPVNPEIDSLVLIEKYTTAARLSFEGVAVARIGQYLPFPWSWLGTIARALPRRLINGLYHAVASRRHALSHSDACPVMPPDWSDRFLP